MKKEIFDFKDYKSYLNNWISQQKSNGRGIKSAIAKAANCQTAYVSQVMNENAHFSLEQAVVISSYLNHNDEETQFFLLLVQYARAGNQALRQQLKNNMQKILEQRSNLKERVDIKKSLDPVDQATYYSSWYYAAIHVAVSIPNLRSLEALSEYFSLDTKTTIKALNFLCSVGLLQKKGNEYNQGVTRLFLGKDSPMIKNITAIGACRPSNNSKKSWMKIYIFRPS